MYSECLSAHYEQEAEEGYMRLTEDYEADVQACMLENLSLINDLVVRVRSHVCFHSFYGCLENHYVYCTLSLPVSVLVCNGILSFHPLVGHKKLLTCCRIKPAEPGGRRGCFLPLYPPLDSVDGLYALLTAIK